MLVDHTKNRNPVIVVNVAETKTDTQQIFITIGEQGMGCLELITKH